MLSPQVSRFFTVKSLLAVLVVVLLVQSRANATIPYAPAGPFVGPVTGPGFQAPATVPGKEHSHDLDFSTAGLGGLVDPQQIIAWDGTGGAADTVDFSMTRPTWQPDQEIDATANTVDTLFDDTVFDQSNLIFSHDDLTTTYVGGVGAGAPALTPVPSGGPVTVSNGSVLGGAGDVSIETSGFFGPIGFQGLWAPQGLVNGMPLPADVDGLEVWGPEPQGPGNPVVGDTDKYSLDTDTPSGTAIWNAAGTPYLSQAAIAAAVTALLGPVPGTAIDFRSGTQGEEAINLDALMVSDILDSPDDFDIDGNFNPQVVDQSGIPLFPDRGDSIIFSIRQIIDPADPDGYYATGSELFVLDSFIGASFLTHGGHLWDHAYALANLAIITPLLGDANGDGLVNLLDLNILAANFGGPGPGGDFNMDGVVNLFDLNILAANWGAMGNPNVTVIDVNAIEAVGSEDFIVVDAIPEPATFALLLFATGLGVLAKRRI